MTMSTFKVLQERRSSHHAECPCDGIIGECGERIKGDDMGYYGHSKGNVIVIEIAHRDCDGSHHAVYVLDAVISLSMMTGRSSESALCGFG